MKKAHAPGGWLEELLVCEEGDLPSTELPPGCWLQWSEMTLSSGVKALASENPPIASPTT